MKKPFLYKLLYVFLLTIFVIVCAFLTSSWMRIRNEHQRFKSHEERFRIEYLKAKGDMNANEAYLKRMKEDPEFFEWVVRQRLGYTRDGEILFRFNEEDS